MSDDFDRLKAQKDAMVQRDRDRIIMAFAPPRCETCGGDGTEAHMFDGLCDAAWAHKYVRAPAPETRSSAGLSGARPPERDDT